MAAYPIAPFHAPLPTAWNLPFQFAAGSQTSILMSESADGVSVAATRQNAGRSVMAFPRPPRPPGTSNAPAATGCAIVIFASGSVSEARLSHVAAFALEEQATRPASIDPTASIC